MFGIHWRFHGTIGPAVLKSTFFVPPGCQNSIPGNILIVAEVLAPCLPCLSLPAAPVHPCLFPSLPASARPPDSGPADRCERSGAFFHSVRKAILGNFGWSRGHPWWSPLPSPCHRHQTPSLHPSIDPGAAKTEPRTQCSKVPHAPSAVGSRATFSFPQASNAANANRAGRNLFFTVLPTPTDRKPV